MLLALSLLSVLSACERETDLDGDGVPASQDCDDSDANISPLSPERCDGVDNDCDGLIDDDDPDVEEDTLDSWYSDRDGDGYGAPSSLLKACEGPEGSVSKGGDCADEDPAIYPGAAEVCDGVDNDCDSLADDADSSLDPESTTTWYPDADQDGFGEAEGRGEQACSTPEGYAADSTDCDDANAAVNPGAVEICEDGLDNDCSGDAPECVLGGTLTTNDAGLTLAGGSGEMNLGASLGVSDFNSDGQPDLVVGAPGSSRYTTEAGEVFTYSEGLVPGGSTSASGSFASFNPYTRFGQDVAMLGAVSADGYPELGLGNDAESGQELVLLYQGSEAGLLARALFFNGELGASAPDRFGAEIAGVGDIDGDGSAAVAVGAPTSDWAGRYAGAVYIWQSPSTSNAYSSADVSIYGQANDYLGDRDTVLGADLDGDSVVDLVLGAPSQARSYLVLGPLPGAASAVDADTQLLGFDEDDYLGLSPLSADLDADGYADLVLGAPGERDKLARSVGATHVFMGRASWESEVSSTASGTTFIGQNDLDGTGAAHAIGDVNEDGLPDLFIGQPGANDGAGAAYLFFGPLPAGRVNVESADLILLSDESGARCGHVGTLAIADMDLDSHPDLLMGCPDAGEDQGGGVYLFFGLGE